MAIIIQVSPSATGAEVKTNTTSLFATQYEPSVAALDGGGYVIVWTGDTRTNFDYDIYQQRYDSSGSPVGPEVIVNTTRTDWQTNPSVAGLVDGGHVVTWISPDGSGSGVYQQRYDATGAPVGSETRVNAVATGNQNGASAVGFDGGGHAVIFASDDGDGSGVFVQRYDSTGAVSGAAVRVNTTTEGEQSNPSIARLANGGYVVSWQAAGQDGSSYGVYEQRFDSSNTPNGVETKVNTHTNNAQFNPSVAALTGGGHAVAWQSLFQISADYSVHVQAYDAAGAAIGPEVAVDTNNLTDQINPKVVALPDGGFSVVWFSYVSSSVFQQRFDASGGKIGSVTTLGTDVRTDFTAIGAASLEGGEIVAAWTTDKVDVNSFDVYHSLTRYPTSMSSAVENVIGNGTSEIILVGSAGLNAGDTITGGAGTDTLRFSGGGTNTAVGATISGIEVIEFTNGTGTVLTVPTSAMAMLVATATGTEDRIVLDAGSFTLAQRRALFDRGVETLSDAQGTFHSSNAAPNLSGDSIVRAKEDNNPVLVLANDSDADGDSLVLVSGSLAISSVTTSQGLTLPLLFGQPMTNAAILSQFVMNDTEISLFNESLFEFLEAGQSVTMVFHYEVSDGVANISNGTLTYKVEVPAANNPDPDQGGGSETGSGSGSTSVQTNTIICSDASGALPPVVESPSNDAAPQPIFEGKHGSNVDGDRFDDVLFQNSATGNIGYINMTDGKAGAFVDLVTALPQGWTLIAAQDLDGDGRADIVVQNANSGSIYFANIASGTPSWSLVKGGLIAAQQAIGIGDFTGDGVADVLVRDAGTGQLLFTSLDRSGAPGEMIPGFDTGFTWRTVGIGDVNRDGASDVLVQEIATGRAAVYDAKNNAWVSVTGEIGQDWIAKEVADLNGDGRADVVFRNSATGDIAWVDMRAGGDGALRTLIEGATGFDLVGSADVDNDGSRDLILQSPTDGATAFVDINAGTVAGWGTVTSALGAQWSAVA